MIYRFGDFEFDEACRELRRAGHVVPIEPKVFQVLRYFLEHRDRVVTKDELLEQCWPDTFVSEAALTRCLTKLRKIVHRDPTAPPVIKTVPRHGYRFVAELITLAHEQASDTLDTPLLPNPPPLLEPVSTAPSAPLETATVPVSDHHALETAAPPEPPAPVAEHRQLTVMFCDLVESTVLAGQLDPEDFRDVMLRYQTTCAGIIERYGGHMAQYLGDGLLVYFGYPHAHEDDAQRAIHAGLEMLTALADLNHRLARHSPRRPLRSGAIQLTPLA